MFQSLSDDTLKCPNCGRPIQLESYFKEFYHWEDERNYYYKTSKGTCSACNITYDDGKWNIPEELLPTEKQISTVKFIRNRLDLPNDKEEGVTKHTYWAFINKYFNKAKEVKSTGVELAYEGDGYYYDPSYINDYIDCSDLGISPWGDS